MTRLDHLLTILAEECAEVTKRTTKALRFGLDEIQPGQELTNRERLAGEVADLVAVLCMLDEEGVALPTPPQQIAQKKAKVNALLEYSATLGRLDPERQEGGNG